MKIFFAIFVVSFALLSAINIDDVLKAGRENSRVLKALKIDVANANTENTISYFDFSPTVKLDASSNYVKGGSKPQNTSLTISQNIAVFDDRFYTVSLSYNTYLQQVINYEKKQKELDYELKNLYCQILLNKKQIEYYENSINAYTATLQMVKELQKVGTKTLLDENSAKLEIENSKLQLNNAKNDFIKNISTLNNLTSLSLTTESVFTEIEFIEPNPIVNYAFYDYELKKLNQSNVQLRKKQSFKNMLPSLNFEVYNENIRNDNFDSNILSKAEYSNNWHIGAFLSFNFGSFYQNMLKHKIATRNKQKIDIEVDDTFKQLKLKFNNLLLDIELKKQELEINKKRLDYAKINKELYQIKYNKAMISFVDFKTAYNDFLNTSLQMFKTKYSYYLLLAEKNKMITTNKGK